MSILVHEKNAPKNIMFIKGAPDYLLERTNKIMNTAGKVIEMNSGEKN
jgi:Ca2+-transporting ATPase